MRFRKAAGLPWFVFLDGDGKAVITSTDPDGRNIGYPGLAGSEPHFRNRGRTANQAPLHPISPADINRAASAHDAGAPPRTQPAGSAP